MLRTNPNTKDFQGRWGLFVFYPVIINLKEYAIFFFFKHANYRTIDLHLCFQQ